MKPNTYVGGGVALTTIQGKPGARVATLEHWWYSPAEVAARELELANWGFAQACVDAHAVPPTSTHFH